MFKRKKSTQTSTSSVSVFTRGKRFLVGLFFWRRRQPKQNQIYFQLLGNVLK